MRNLEASGDGRRGVVADKLVSATRSYEATTPEAVMQGTGKVWTSDGKIRFESDPTGIGGTMTLPEGVGKRVLIELRDDGFLFKLTPTKEV